MSWFAIALITVAIGAIVVAAVVILKTYVKRSHRKSMSMEGFNDNLKTASHDDFTRYKVCGSQDVCTAQRISKEKCDTPEIDGVKCCAFNPTTRSCGPKWSNPVPNDLKVGKL